MQVTDQNIQWYQSRFEVFEQSLNGAKSTSVHAMRRDAMQRFMELGFPTTSAGGMAIHQHCANHKKRIPADSPL